MPKLKESEKADGTVGRHTLANALEERVGIQPIDGRTGKIAAHQRALEIVDAVFEIIEEELALPGGRVCVTGFGTWTLKDRAARKGVTGFGDDTVAWSRPAGVSVRFSPGKSLNERLNANA